MKTNIINIQTDRINDWETFHGVFQEALGFPEFYGRNMNAWIDCMSGLDDQDSGMTKFTVNKDDIAIMKIENSSSFKERCPEQYNALIECSAFVNYSRIDIGENPILSLMFIGDD